MSAVVWANIMLTIPFLVTFIGVPLWMTFKRPQTGPDHADARAYLRTKGAFAAALSRRQAVRAKAPAGAGGAVRRSAA